MPPEIVSNGPSVKFDLTYLHSDAAPWAAPCSLRGELRTSAASFPIMLERQARGWQARNAKTPLLRFVVDLLWTSLHKLYKKSKTNSQQGNRIHQTSLSVPPPDQLDET